MQPIWRTLSFAAFFALATGPAVAQNAAESPAAQQDEVLAEGSGGAFTRDAAEAYIEALEFTLGELGQPTTFEPGQRGQIRDALAAGFPGLPAEVQNDLANARPLWTQYRSAWNTLLPQAKQEFAYYVLALAYGEQAAAEALGLSAEEGGGGGDQGPSVDDMIGNVPGTTDCWGSAGCTGYDAGTGTYTFEE